MPIRYESAELASCHFQDHAQEAIQQEDLAELEAPVQEA